MTRLEAELTRLRVENADLQKTIDEQCDDINTLAEERQRLRAVVDRLGDAEMVVPCHWDGNFLRVEWSPIIYHEDQNEAERQYGVIRLREAGEKAS